MGSTKKILMAGTIWILIGIIVILLSQLYSQEKDLKLVAIDLSLQFGIAFVIMGIIAIIVQFKDWKVYFQERLKEIVMERAYLETLSDNEISSLQIDTLKAKYKTSNIDREGSFLHYFQQKIQDFINYPYRENVSSSTMIKEDKNNKGFFKVYESTTYICRSIGNNIQENVKWLYEEDEFVEVNDFKLRLKCPGILNKKCEIYCKDKKNCNEGIITLDKKSIDQKYKQEEDDDIKGYVIPLKSLVEPLDHLQVELDTCVTMDLDRLFTWAMTHPSKGINFTITYPEGYKLHTFVGGIEPREYSNNHNDNMYIFTHDGWFLPRTGIAWSLSKIKTENNELIAERADPD